jgi:1-acyl-sn-glycerol-3-phosphate acyltransferase
MKIIREILSRFGLLFLALSAVYIFKVRNRIKIYGRENIPKGKGILFVCNHQTLIDSLLIGISVSSVFDAIFHYRRIPFNCPDYNNFFKHPIGKQLTLLSKCVPVHRHVLHQKIIDQDIANLCSLLEKNNLVIFFEGTRTRDGSIGVCKTGVAKIISRVRPAYVVPICLSGIQPIMPIKSGFNFTKIYGGNRGDIIIGRPIMFDSYDNEQEIKGKIRDSVMDLKED